MKSLVLSILLLGILSTDASAQWRWRPGGGYTVPRGGGYVWRPPVQRRVYYPPKQHVTGGIPGQTAGPTCYMIRNGVCYLY